MKLGLKISYDFKRVNKYLIDQFCLKFKKNTPGNCHKLYNDFFKLKRNVQ